MITWLNKNGENVPLAKYIFNNGNEPSFYEWPSDTSGFDTYMNTLLTAKGFLSTPGLKIDGPDQSVSATTESFDEAFWDFIKGPSQPDKYSTRNWLMLGPSPE